MRQMVIRGNAFTGIFSLPEVSKGVTFLNISFNTFEGSLDLTQLPSKITYFSAVSNRFSRALDLTKLPKDIDMFYMDANKFHGSIDLTLLPPKLRFLNLSDNLLGQDNLIINADISGYREITVESFTFGGIHLANGRVPNIHLNGPIKSIQYDTNTDIKF